MEILIKSDDITIIREVEKLLTNVKRLKPLINKQINTIGTTYDKDLTIINID